MYALSVQATSDVGSAGLYLEDYFEEQVKLVYPERLFPGGREEQMIPPLEDEIEEEEEMMGEGMAPIEDDKPISPAGEEIPPVEDDSTVEETTVPVEENKSEKEMETEMETDVTAAEEGDMPPSEEAKQDEETPVKEAQSSPAADSETKDKSVPSSLENESSDLLTDTTEDPPDTQKTESAPADTAKEGGSDHNREAL